MVHERTLTVVTSLFKMRSCFFVILFNNSEKKNLRPAEHGNKNKLFPELPFLSHEICFELGFSKFKLYNLCHLLSVCGPGFVEHSLCTTSTVQS